MSQLPHSYEMQATAETEGSVATQKTGLPTLSVMPPSEFGGPGDQWSPEDLLMAALSSCLVLSFKAIVKASKLEWQSIKVNVSGELDKVERVVKFTRVTINARLTIPSGGDIEKARSLLQKAEASCFVSNSLNAELQFEPEVICA